MNPALTALAAAVVGGLAGGALVLTTLEGPEGPQGAAGKPGPAVKGAYVLVNERNACPAGTNPFQGEVSVNINSGKGVSLFRLCVIR